MHNITHQIDEPSTIDIWVIPLSSSSNPDQLSILDSNEQQRYHQLRSDKQPAFLQSHMACREILSSYLGIPPEDITYAHAEHGKPYVNNSPIFFNLSHSHQQALLAISESPEVGVDIEFCEPRPAYPKIAQRFFHESEIKLLFDQDEPQQLRLFFQLWTRKEAYLKATGQGLRCQLSSFDCHQQGSISLDAATEASWYQRDLVLDAPYVGSLVLNTPITKIRYYSFA